MAAIAMEYPPIWKRTDAAAVVSSKLRLPLDSSYRRERRAHEVDQPSRLAHGFGANDGKVAFGHNVADGAVQHDIGRDPGFGEDGLSFEPKSELPAKGRLGVSIGRRKRGPARDPYRP